MAPSIRTRGNALTTATGLAVGAALPGTWAAQTAPIPPVATQYTNAVLRQGFADIDVIRVGDTYYCSASTMHYSPGAPILRSYDLVNWEFAGYSVPVLDSGPSTT